MLTLWALAPSPPAVGAGRILKKILNKFKTGYGWETLACSFHRNLYTRSSCWAGLLPITHEFLAFVRYQQNYRQNVFIWETTFAQGGIDILKFAKKSTDLLCFILQFLGYWSFWGD